MNLQQLPNDIHYIIMNKTESHSDLINLGKTNKFFNNLIKNNNIKIKAELFRINITLNFKVDINKHSILCKKFKNLSNYFNERVFKITIERKITKSIFDESTIIYFNVFFDNLNVFQSNFNKFFLDNNICKSSFINDMIYNFHIYIDEEFLIKLKNDNLTFNREDIQIDNETNIKLYGPNNILGISDWLIGRILTNSNANDTDRSNIGNLNFFNLLEGINTIMYDIKQFEPNNIQMNNILVLEKDIVLDFFRENYLYYKILTDLVNDEILEELNSPNPNIENVDNLVLILHKRKNKMSYMINIREYLIDNNININNMPKYSEPWRFHLKAIVNFHRV